MRTVSSENGDVQLILEETSVPVAVLKSRELSDDMRELLSQGIVLPVCEMVLKLHRLRVYELEAILRPNE